MLSNFSGLWLLYLIFTNEDAFLVALKLKNYLLFFPFFGAG